MDSGPSIAELPDGRVHAQHGPIDLIVTVDAPHLVREGAIQSLQRSLDGLLAALVWDLPQLREVVTPGLVGATPTSRRMIDAAAALTQHAFITPMAAVAGSVADTVCAAMWNEGIDRLIVNNGGDIALRLANGQSVSVGIGETRTGVVLGRVLVHSSHLVGGVATSGRGGRSLTTGIADFVTVFASNAAAADAAATIIAGAVDLRSSEKIRRRPARDIDESSDLGDREVVVGVAPLSRDEEHRALSSGLSLAKRLQQQGLISAAILCLGDSHIELSGVGTQKHSSGVARSSTVLALPGASARERSSRAGERGVATEGRRSVVGRRKPSGLRPDRWRRWARLRVDAMSLAKVRARRRELCGVCGEQECGGLRMGCCDAAICPGCQAALVTGPMTTRAAITCRFCGHKRTWNDLVVISWPAM